MSAVDLRDLAAELDGAVLRRDTGHVEIPDLTHDSRAVAPGMLFCAVPGAESDGHDHAPAALAAGAAALLVERELDLDVPQIVVPRGAAGHGPGRSGGVRPSVPHGHRRGGHRHQRARPRPPTSSPP